jgi:Domain of unknown function (DUF4304)
MTDAGDQMTKALKDIVVPRLRELGFEGSFPHLRRRRADRVDLFTFQFDRHGGGFIVEIAQCAPEGVTTHWGKQIAANKVTAWDLPPAQRARIRPGEGSGTASWFRYDAGEADARFRQTAESVLPYIEQAERMFDDFDRARKVGRAD